jgi:hypothetical protein
MSDKQKRITGQLFFRDTPKNANGPAGPGRKLMMVVGIVAVPEDIDIKGEHQYVVSGGKSRNDPSGSFIELGMLTDKGVVDQTAVGRGNTIGDLLKEGIWQC